MEQRFFYVDEKRKQYIKRWLCSVPEYQSKKKIVNLLYTVSVVLFVLHVGMPTISFFMGRCNAATIGAGAGVGLAMAVIPFAFARPISAKAKKSCGLPYTGREQECLVIYEDGVEFFFHNAASRYSESMDVYRIPLENINAVRYNVTYHIVTIIGQGELLSYDDYPSKRLNHQNSQRRFYSNSPYSILTAFNEEEKAVTLLCSMAKNQLGVSILNSEQLGY